MENKSISDFEVQILPPLKEEVALSKTITAIYPIINCGFDSFRIIPEKPETPRQTKE